MNGCLSCCGTEVMVMMMVSDDGRVGGGLSSCTKLVLVRNVWGCLSSCCNELVIIDMMMINV